MTEMRLQKYLSGAGYCSRRKGEELILSGRVTINAETAVLGTKIDPLNDVVKVDGKPVLFKINPVVIAYNKPRGVVCSLSHKGKTTLTDVIKIKERVYPIGRLDEDSQGLLLLTNDGRLHHGLLHPSFEHEKEYRVTVIGGISNGSLLKMSAGLTLGEEKTQPCKIRRIDDHTFHIILREGKNRQIRRMVRKTGGKVDRLKRIRFCNIRLGKLSEGAWRHLSPKEMKGLYAYADIPIDGEKPKNRRKS